MNTIPVVQETVSQKLWRLLAIKEEDVLEAVMEGYRRRFNYVAPCYPVIAAGMITWIEITGILREILSSRYGWESTSVSCHERVVSPDGRNMIVVSHADLDGEKVTTHGKKGGIAEKAVMENFRQLELFSGFKPNGQPISDLPSDPLMWYLLHDFNQETGIVRCRLGVPTDISDGKPTDFDPERDIIFDPFDVSEGARVGLENYLDEFDVQVIRKEHGK